MAAVVAFAVANKATILGALWAVSEVLGLIPSVAANGIFDGIKKLLASVLKK